MIITEKFCEETVDDSKLAEFEQEIRLPLPASYREFLKANNGGRPSPSKFECKDGEGSLVHYFYALHSGRIGNLLEKAKTFLNRIPFGYLPIATDPFGNQIVIKLMARRDTAVYFWDHENEAEDEPTMENMHLINESFEAFIKSLHD